MYMHNVLCPVQVDRGRITQLKQEKKTGFRVRVGECGRKMDD